MHERRFELPDNQGIVVFALPVLRHMYQYAQTSLCSKEAGGQLFSPSPDESMVPISIATGPHPQDRRSRHGFYPDFKMIMRDRHHQFSKGMHAVGLWHTHPEALPTPSDKDRDTAQEYLKSFGPDMHGFLLVTLGNKGNPLNLAVWIAWKRNRSSWLRLNEVHGRHCNDAIKERDGPPPANK